MALSTIGAGSLADGAITTAKIAADAITNAKVADDAIQTENVAAGASFGRRNIIMNGDFRIAQRGASSTGVGADGVSGLHNVDRWRIDIGATSAGRVTMAQTAVTDLAGFANSMKISCTTADTSIAAGEALIFDQRVEGQNLQRLTASSTSTQAFTLSFYAKSNASRAIASEINFSNGTNKQMSKLHTIGTSWARYTMTVPAASSTQIDDDNSHELSINFWLHAGSTYTGGTLNDDALDSITNANRAAGIGSIFASTDNFFEITGVQLELGSTATDFEHRSFEEEFAECRRYFYKIQAATTYMKFGMGRAWSTDDMACALYLPTPMRSTPTLATSTIGSNFGVAGVGTNVSAITLAERNTHNQFMALNIAYGATSFSTGTIYQVESDNNTDAFVSFDAEL